MDGHVGVEGAEDLFVHPPDELQFIHGVEKVVFCPEGGLPGLVIGGFGAPDAGGVVCVEPVENGVGQ